MNINVNSRKASGKRATVGDGVNFAYNTGADQKSDRPGFNMTAGSMVSNLNSTGR
jgi:hypothetical protein